MLPAQSKNLKIFPTIEKKSLSRLELKHCLILGGGGGIHDLTLWKAMKCVCMCYVHTRMKPMEIPKWKSKIQLRINSIIHRYTKQFIPFKVTLFKMKREE
jgi:hypothetical protein